MAYSKHSKYNNHSYFIERAARHQSVKHVFVKLVFRGITYHSYQLSRFYRDYPDICVVIPTSRKSIFPKISAWGYGHTGTCRYIISCIKIDRDRVFRSRSLLLMPCQGRRKLPRDGAALAGDFGGRAAAESVSAQSAEFFFYPIF